jgi:hypothetical protein
MHTHIAKLILFQSGIKKVRTILQREPGALLGFVDCVSK